MIHAPDRQFEKSELLGHDARVVLNIGIAVLIASTASRSFVAFGAPALVDFVHIPLVLCAVAMSPRLIRASRACRRSCLWIGVLLVVSIASWLDSGGQLVRPFAEWILLAEPLLFGVALIAALLALPEPARLVHARRLELTVILIAVAQLVFGLAVLLRGGFGDHVQGTFIGLGSGAHIAGAVATVGAIAACARAFRDRQNRGRWLLLATALMLLTIAADAKQIIIAAIPAILLLILLGNIVVRGSARAQRRARYGALVLGVLFFASLFVIYAPLRNGGQNYSVSGSNGKFLATELIVKAMSGRPETFLVGLGPGNTVGKLATLTGSGLKGASPVAFLHLSQSEITAKVLALDNSNYVIASSSVWTGLSSALGLFGDLGLLGVLAYVMAWWALVRGVGRRQSTERAVVIALATFGAILAILMIWLEEPNFMLPLVALLASAVASASIAPAPGRTPSLAA
jgi:hypothetical protein